MPALFGYVFAVLVLLGGGYAGLQWLAEPLPVPSHSPVAGGKLSSKNKTLAQKSEPPYTGSDDRQSSEPGSAPSSNVSISPTQAAATPLPADDASQNTGAIPQTNPEKEVGDIPRGGCMPFGVTGKGELVFPMECKAVLTRNWDSQTPSQPSSTASRREANQSEPARQTETAASAEVVPLNPAAGPDEATRTKPDANAKIADAPANPDVAMTPNKERAETEVNKLSKATKKASQPVRPKGVMMVLRTIEFPDGHREQRLMTMDHWRRTAVRTEQW
jgi:hypothetical protein